MREIKFRAWDKINKVTIVVYVLDQTINGGNGKTHYPKSKGHHATGIPHQVTFNIDDVELMQFTGIRDKNKKEIYVGDILEFSDKWEWYRTKYGIKMRFAEPARLAELQKQYDAEPMERRLIEMPGCYEWILSSEIQTYWEVIGNIHENPELLK